MLLSLSPTRLIALLLPLTYSLEAVDAVAGTIAWPNGVDLDPDVLHGDHEPARGRSPVVLKEYHLRPSG